MRFDSITKTKSSAEKFILKPRFNILGSLMCGLGILFSFTTTIVRADVRLPAIFSDHMVRQHDTTVPVWDWAEPGEAVTVAIAGQTKSATADAAGKWSVKLDKLSASESLTLLQTSHAGNAVSGVCIPLSPPVFALRATTRQATLILKGFVKFKLQYQRPVPTNPPLFRVVCRCYSGRISPPFHTVR
jgi:hypothetical protein